MIFLASAFIAVWLLVGLYVLYMGAQQRRLDAEVATLTELVEERRRE